MLVIAIGVIVNAITVHATQTYVLVIQNVIVNAIIVVVMIIVLMHVRVQADQITTVMLPIVN